MHQRMDQSAPTAQPTRCRHCGEAFAPKKPWQLFCKTACRRDFHKAGGESGLVKRVAELEQRVRDLEAAIWPLGK